MVTNRPFEELNLWQRIFAEHWDSFVVKYEQEQGQPIPEHWQENVERMLSCGDIRQGFYEYLCQDCGTTKKVGFTCKSKLCLRCFKVAVDDWLDTARKVLFEGVIHRQVVLTAPTHIRPLVLAEAKFLKVYMDSGAKAVKELIEQWRRKRKIRAGIMAVLQIHGRAGNRNPHLHFVVSEGGLDKDNNWRGVNFFDTKKLRKKWQYQVIMGLKNAVKGTAYEGEWYDKLGSMFRLYPSGFDCDCMPEEGPVDRLVIYLCKYVSSPPISIRRIESYDGQNITYRYEDHRKGLVHETLSATEFIGRMMQHLPPKGFRMVRYYGIYARPIRDKVHEMIASVLKGLARTAEKVAEYFARKRGISPEKYRRKLDERLGNRKTRCEKCGSTRMLLIRIWSKNAGMIYEIGKDDLCIAEGRGQINGKKMDVPRISHEQLVFAF